MAKTTSKGYDPNKDYSKELQRTDLTSAQRSQLERERQAKINDKYKGVEPVMTGSNKTYSQTYGSSSSGKSTSSSSSSRNTSSSSATRPSSGGSSYGSGTSYSSGGSYNQTVDYHQQAKDAAARGDWDAVSKALADRQAKIDRQGGNDRGTSNAQILAQLQSQYGGSYGALSGGTRDKVDLNAGYSIPYGTYTGDTGQVYKDQGWQAGTDYLDTAQRLARAGDLEGAYEALMRRGFKMADTGSQGGGTTQDQAYAMIHQLYNQSDTARRQYQNELDINRQRLQDHQTQFGLQTRPELAGKRILSTDGQYWILYDQNGTPAITKPNNQKSGGARYSDDQLALMYQYYAGDYDNFSELQRQIHNMDVVRTGVGRLIDQGGNYASGTPIQPVTANDWTGLPQTDRYQDKGALQAILNQINAGQTYEGGSTQVPTDQLAAYLAALPTGGTGGGKSSVSGSIGGGSYGGGSYGGTGGYGYGGDDLSSYLRQIYEQNLQAQLAGLRAAYEQNLAGYQAHDDLIAQSYLDQRNQAAAQNDLQRMYMAEMGGMQGLNTGATGQLALAQSAAYQQGLANLMSAENQDRAANDLAIRNLATAYQGDMAQAAAQSNSDLAGALYNEYVRQIQAAEAERQAALAQSNWERQFAYQQQQDALAQRNWQTQWDYGLQADQRESAYGMAANLLKNGILPDSATLAAAGISQADAAGLVQAYQQAALQSTKRSGSSGGAKSSGGGLTYAQAKALLDDGMVTDNAIAAFEKAAGAGAYEKFYGGTSGGTTGGGDSGGDGGIPSAAQSGNYSTLRNQLTSIPGLTEANKVSIIESAWKSGRITENEASDLLSFIGYN